MRLQAERLPLIQCYMEDSCTHLQHRVTLACNLLEGWTLVVRDIQAGNLDALQR